MLVLKPDSTVEYRPVSLGRLVDGSASSPAGSSRASTSWSTACSGCGPGMQVNATAGPMLADAGKGDGPPGR